VAAGKHRQSLNLGGPHEARAQEVDAARCLPGVRGASHPTGGRPARPQDPHLGNALTVHFLNEISSGRDTGRSRCRRPSRCSTGRCRTEGRAGHGLRAHVNLVPAVIRRYVPDETSLPAGTGFAISPPPLRLRLDDAPGTEDQPGRRSHAESRGERRPARQVRVRWAAGVLRPRGAGI